MYEIAKNLESFYENIKLLTFLNLYKKIFH